MANRINELFGYELMPDLSMLDEGSEIPGGKSSYVYGGKAYSSKSGKTHDDIHRDAGRDLFAELDDPISVNANVDGSSVVKIERKNKNGRIRRENADILIDAIAKSPANRQFDFDGMPMTRDELLEYIYGIVGD